MFTLKGVCAIRRSKQKKTYLAFMDISKAFDTINRSMLFYHIYVNGIQGKAFQMIKMLYEKVDNKVIFGSIESDIYQVNTGVKQGCVLSPCLFNLVMVDLEKMLHGVGGVDVGSFCLNGLFYADDIVLFGENERGLLDMLDIADSFAKKWGLTFSEKKSKILIIGKKCSDKLWPMGDKLLQETSSYKYLGVLINSSHH